MKHRHTLRPAGRLLAITAAAALLLNACGGGDSDGKGAAPAKAISQQKIDDAMNTPTKLVFWTWVPDIQKEVDLFMKEYPDIDVTVENVGQGAPHYQKLRTALESGKGAPDVAQMEFQYTSSFRVGDTVLDLAPYGAADLKDQYAEWIWNQISDGAAVYGI